MKKICFWGTGTHASIIVHDLYGFIFSEYEVIGFVDNNPRISKKEFLDRPVVTPKDIAQLGHFDLLIILVSAYESIRNQAINELGCEPEIIKPEHYLYEQIMTRRYDKTEDKEIQSVLKYVRQYGAEMFNYEFVKKYKLEPENVLFDSKKCMYYLFHQNKKMYFSRDFSSKEAVAEYYRSLLIEQDIESPHRYTDCDFLVNEGDVVVDAGVAEGNFSLENIEKVSKLYIIETDNAWIEALKETFREYLDKIVFINKFLTSFDNGIYASLDSLIEEPVNFIKMDIEGNEWDALLGAKRLIELSPRLRCAVCSYHTDFDEILIKSILQGYGMECTTTNGYVWFPHIIRTNYITTKLHRGIVRAEKGCS